MKAKLVMKLGNKQLSFEGDGSPKEIIKNLSFWGTLPSLCGMCQSDDISLFHKAPGGHDYYGLKCCKCGSELNFGQHKVGDGFFLKSDAVWTKWEGKKELSASPEVSPSPNSPF